MDSAANGASNEELKTALEASGQRYTGQRAAVYQYLRSVTSHPTADEIFTRVREVMPDISLATVYKALEAFVAVGAARKLSMGGGPARYDGRTDDHDHVRCLKCGTVLDVVGTHDPMLIRGLTSEDGFEIFDYRLELIGHCSTCRS